MADIYARIKTPVQAEMEIFEIKFRESMKSTTPLLDTITRYIIKRKGKQLRPLFVFLTAKLFSDINDSTYRAASLIELMHTATLVHDDVVDDSQLRRGFFSINALWKNKIAVLVGDYLLARGLLLSVEHKEFTLLEIVSQATREMAEGELLQIEKARKLDINEAVYFEVIRKKTASLITACCAAGLASTNNKSLEDMQTIKKFGELVGIAFQIKDDLFDYGTDDVGKPLGNDLKEKKMTLPLIHALNKSSWIEKQKIIYIIKSNNNDTQKVKQVLEFVTKHNGIAYATERMLAIKNEALLLLHKFNNNEARQALELLVNYTVERKR
ncbi:MAG: polyprenyl synthetase family protein [Bacteroidia bacterium]|nr:polyprenyl synthetase family protein [Bacteroidia bacterium]